MGSPHAHHATSRFAPGQFLGQAGRRRRFDAATLADMRPTVPAHEVEMHHHDDAHFVVVHRGAYASSARGMPAVCDVPAIVFNPPGTQHRDCFASLEAARFLTISIAAPAWKAATAGRADEAGFARRLPATALPAAYRIWRELLAGDDVSPLVVATELHALLAYAEQGDAKRAAIAVPAWLHHARARIEDAPGDVPTVADLAREAGLHPVYLARAFRRAYGCAPGELLRRRRVEAAIAAVCAGRGALPEIAQRCGYADQSHMHLAVRRATGLTPGALRGLGSL